MKFGEGCMQKIATQRLHKDKYCLFFCQIQNTISFFVFKMYNDCQIRNTVILGSWTGEKILHYRMVYYECHKLAVKTTENSYKE